MENQTNEGRKLSFHQLFKEMEFNVVIPIIQRDYAQGRKKAENIRNQFVTNLLDALVEKKNLHLDFIYGNVENNDFIPLDGQQRLTTLFLLHWYLSIKDDNFEDFQDLMMKQENSRFTYKTRISSRLFCDKLVENKIELSEDFPTYSEHIKDCNWYFASWDRDPTISSMLVMLDTIDSIYKDKDIRTDLYKFLVNDETPIITFQFIELKDFGLSDSLYIKMNARGKPLTDFENFKAKFEQLLKKYDEEKDQNYKEEFEKKIDTDWADLFWEFRSNGSELFDNEFMNFVRVVLTNSLASNPDVDMEALKVMTREKASFGFYELDRFNSFSNRGLEDLMLFLRLINNEGSFCEYINVNKTINEVELFKDVTNYDLTYSKRIQFYSLYKYIERYPDKEGIDDWMRIIRNLSSNSVYRQADSFETAIKSVDNMLPHSNTIISYFQKGNKPKGFLQYQVEEEIIKSHLIQKDKNWRKEIEKIENHGYFNGQIEFILSFSGISDFFNKNSDLNWSNKENQLFFDQFVEYANVAKKLFNDHGLTNFPEYKFRRALLAIGNYTLKKSRNNSFLVNVDREIGWKRLLRDSNNGKREFVKTLFDKLLGTENIEEVLDSIISTSDISDWRKYFVQRRGCIHVCGKEHLFRVGYDNDYTDILLLEKRQTNGKHREYYSFALFCLLEEQGNNVEYLTSNSIDYWKNIAKINNTEIVIKWQSKEPTFDHNNCYIVEGDNEMYFEKESQVIDYLTTNKII